MTQFVGFASPVSSSTSSSPSSMASQAGPPPQPIEPGPEECCQRGCKVCVWDVYRDKMDAWTSYMQQNYPHLLQPENKATAQRQMVDASMDAFAALERQLEQQQQEQQRRQQSQQQQQQQPGLQMDTD